MQEKCPQCLSSLDDASKRLVKDSCGHYKCRVCLLNDVESCGQCKEKNVKQSAEIIDVALEENCGSNGSHSEKTNKEPVNDARNTENGTEAKVGKRKIKSLGKRLYKTLFVPNHVSVSDNPVSYTCTICQKVFTTKSHIKYHIYCSGGPKPFKCDICGKDYIMQSHLEAHILKHMGTKPFTCSKCNKSFREKSKLRRHNLVVHLQKNSFICPQCGKAFKSNDSLKIHSLLHKELKPFACTVCNIRFSNSSNLNKHMAKHSDEKAHMCDQCGKRFKLKWALTVHRRSHLKERPFGCKICTKSFVNKKDLQRHELIHLDSKLYKCGICHSGFRRRDNLNRHIKNTHPGKSADVIKSDIKPQILIPSKPVVDNPNAINVITASPSLNRPIRQPSPMDNKLESRSSTVINGPLKLAFKTSAFKRNYNISRDFSYEQPVKPFDLAESVNICQKILKPQSPPMRKIIEKAPEICQKKFSPYSVPNISSDNYYDGKIHVVKNIKFKIPDSYTNLRNTSDVLKDLIPLKPVANVEQVKPPGGAVFAELTSTNNVATSVIVNTADQPNMHWRRRMSQNVCFKDID